MTRRRSQRDACFRRCYRRFHRRRIGRRRVQVTLLGTGLPFPNPKRRGPGYVVRA